MPDSPSATALQKQADASIQRQAASRRDKKMINGIYSAYMSGISGFGLVIMVFQNGIITGADAGGTKFDGEYKFNEQSRRYIGKMVVDVPPFTTIIQGSTSGPDGMKYTVDLDMGENFINDPFLKFSTPHGPVNVRLEKLRNFDQTR